jgi:beta-xylosidase
MEPIELIYGRNDVIGYERKGEHHQQRKPEEIEARVKAIASSLPEVSDDLLQKLRTVFGNDPFIEGAWMDKHNGQYYLQYAAPGTEYNIYADGVYVSSHPLGPFTLAKNNPYSYKPGGFIPGAGHGSTMQDKHGNWWHASTMRIRSYP